MFAKKYVEKENEFQCFYLPKDINVYTLIITQQHFEYTLKTFNVVTILAWLSIDYLLSSSTL